MLADCAIPAAAVVPPSMHRMHEVCAGDNGSFRAVDARIRKDASPHPVWSTGALKLTRRQKMALRCQRPNGKFRWYSGFNLTISDGSEGARLCENSKIPPKLGEFSIGRKIRFNEINDLGLSSLLRPCDIRSNREFSHTLGQFRPCSKSSTTAIYGTKCSCWAWPERRVYLQLRACREPSRQGRK